MTEQDLTPISFPANPWQSARVAVHDAIDNERQHQKRKYGDDEDTPLPAFILILKNELDEARDAILGDEPGDALNGARRELLQVAAVAVAALERFGTIDRQNETELEWAVYAKERPSNSRKVYAFDDWRAALTGYAIKTHGWSGKSAASTFLFTNQNVWSAYHSDDYTPQECFEEVVPDDKKR